MMSNRLPIAFVFVLLAALAFAAQDHRPGSGDMQDDMLANIYPVAEAKWQPGPPSLPKGSQFVVLEGDPAKEGPFVFRAKLPDGFRIPPHTHPKVERVTVISGTFHLGMGETFSEEGAVEMPAGTYGFWPAGMKHFAWAEGETIVQVHGIGPWSINYLNPDDDPRNSARP